MRSSVIFWVSVCAVVGMASMWLYHPVLELPFDIDDRAAATGMTRSGLLAAAARGRLESDSA